MSEYEQEDFEGIDPEPQGQPQGQPQPDDPYADRFHAIENGLYNLAQHVVNMGQYEEEPAEPQSFPEMTLRPTAEGGWELVNPEQPEPEGPTPEQLVAQALQPYAPILSAAEKAHTDAVVNNAFDTIVENAKASGQELNFDRTLARDYAEMYAQTGQASSFEDAIKSGVVKAMLIQHQLGQVSNQEREDHLKALAQHRAGPGAGGAASESPEVPTGTDAYDRNQEQFFNARRGALRPVS